MGSRAGCNRPPGPLRWPQTWHGCGKAPVCPLAGAWQSAQAGRPLGKLDPCTAAVEQRLHMQPDNSDDGTAHLAGECALLGTGGHHAHQAQHIVASLAVPS